MKKTALLTVIYPVELAFVYEFFQSLVNQTDHDFDVLIINDGFGSLTALEDKFSDLNIIELPSQHNIAKNRENLIKSALSQGYDYAIFGDIDDYFSENRIDISKRYLNEHDIVVNELIAVHDNKEISAGILSKRLKNSALIKLDAIKNKNLFGLSNTAINLNKVNVETIHFPKQVIAVDWYLYSLLLLERKSAIFTNSAITYYRQHESNTAGIPQITSENLTHTLNVRAQHYLHMQDNSPDYADFYNKNKEVSERVKRNDYKVKLIEQNNKEIVHPLWWELTDLGSRNEINC